MEWTRSDTIALAKNRCTQCHGLGLRTSRRGGSNPCNCVLREIFRACYRRFRYCATKDKYMSRVSLERVSGPRGRMTWGFKDEEYCADFILESKRTLDEFEYKVFKYHFLLGADWKLCCRKLGLDRGNFFHCVYRIEQKLGRVFRELQPYGLWPLDEYFHGTVRTRPRPVAALPAGRQQDDPGRPVRAPLAQSA
jgi:hypothetical protein